METTFYIIKAARENLISTLDFFYVCYWFHILEQVLTPHRHSRTTYIVHPYSCSLAAAHKALQDFSSARVDNRHKIYIIIFYSIPELRQLEELDISYNAFTEIPSVITQLPSLQSLEMCNNTRLLTLKGEVVFIQTLEYINCKGCYSVTGLSQEAMDKGLYALRRYYKANRA